MIYDLSTEFDRKRAAMRFEALSQAGDVVELKKQARKRSRNQNAYIHAILSIYAIETGYRLEEAKTLIKRELGLVYERNGHKFLRSTTSLDSQEMADFTDRFRTFAAQQGIYLHTPDEYRCGGWVEVKKVIDQHKEYL